MKNFAWEMFEHERFRRVAEYWDQARGDRLLPHRTDFKFSAYPELATDCAIFSRSEEGEVRIWYAGAKLLQEADMAAAGTNLYDVFPASLRRAYRTCSSEAFSFPCAYINHFSGMMLVGREGNLKNLNLPLSDKNGATRYVLSVTLYGADDMGARFDRFFEHVSRLRFQPIDIGAGCPEPVDVTAETDFK